MASIEVLGLAGRRTARSAGQVLLILAGIWFASQIQRFALAAYLGASTLMLDLGITAAAAGLLAAVYFPVYGSVQIPSGILADQGNPRNNLLIGSALMILAGLAFAVAPTVETAIAARIAVGLTAGFLWLSSIKICSLLDGQGYAHRLSFLIAVGAVGTILGLAGLPALLSALHWRVVAGLVTLPTLTMALLLLLADTPRPEQPASAAELWDRCIGTLRRVPEILGRLDFWRISLPNMLWTGTQFAALTWLPRYARDVLALPTAAVGVLPALVPLGQIAGSAALAYIHSRRPTLGLPLFFATCCTYVVAMAFLATGLAAQAGPAALYVLAVGMGVLFGSFFISLAWIADAVEPSLLGTASGVMNALGFFPAFILPWAMGGLMDVVDRPTSPAWQYSPQAYYLAFGLTAAVLAAGLLGSALISLRLRAQRRQMPPDVSRAARELSQRR